MYEASMVFSSLLQGSYVISFNQSHQLNTEKAKGKDQKQVRTWSPGERMGKTNRWQHQLGQVLTWPWIGKAIGSHPA